MAITNPQTLTTLGELGCIINGKVDTNAVARLLAQRLEAEHIASSMDDIGMTEVTVGQLAGALIGAEDEEFINTIRPLLSATANGKVQQALSNGYMLCARRAKVQVNMEGEIRTVSVPTRFLSSDHDVVDQYVLQPRIQRTERLAESNVALRQLVERRQPTMGPRLQSFMERLNVSWRRAIES